MSSKVKWGGIAGLVAAALLIVSAVLNQMSPVLQTYDSAANYLYLVVVVAAYIAVIVAVWAFMPCTAEGLGTAAWEQPAWYSPSLGTRSSLS